MPRVAFQGERGAFSEGAIVRRWGGLALPIPHRDCLAVARAVDRGDADFGVLPIENSLAGAVAAACDALRAAAVTVVDEVVLPIEQCLLALPGAHLEQLASVESHPIALAQCRRFLAAHPHLQPRASYDTAGAAREVAQRSDVRCAAIGPRLAGELYGLDVLADAVQDRADNRTRFVVIARRTVEACAGASEGHGHA